MKKDDREYINWSTKDKGVSIMPTIESVECERTAYLREMKNYLKRLKSLPNAEARKKSQQNLENCHIIQKDGEFAERYKYSRKLFENKG